MSDRLMHHLIVVTVSDLFSAKGAAFISSSPRREFVQCQTALLALNKSAVYDRRIQ